MEIHYIGSNEWKVFSDSGNTYIVRCKEKLVEGFLDNEAGETYIAWSCNCLSRQYPCKHIIAVKEKG